MSLKLKLGVLIFIGLVAIGVTLRAPAEERDPKNSPYFVEVHQRSISNMNRRGVVFGDESARTAVESPGEVDPLGVTADDEDPMCNTEDPSCDFTEDPLHPSCGFTYNPDIEPVCTGDPHYCTDEQAFCTEDTWCTQDPILPMCNTQDPSGMCTETPTSPFCEPTFNPFDDDCMNYTSEEVCYTKDAGAGDCTSDPACTEDPSNLWCYYTFQPSLCTSDPGSQYCSGSFTQVAGDPNCQTSDGMWCTSEQLSPWCATIDPWACTDEPQSDYCVYTNTPAWCTNDPGAPMCDTNYTTDPDDPPCQTDDPFFCTDDPSDPYCQYTFSPFCVTSHPLCLTMSPFCVTDDPFYCTTDPLSPYCLQQYTDDPYFCTTDPSSPYCDSVWTTEPSDPDCETADPFFCTGEPLSPWCETSDPFYCTQDPLSPYCAEQYTDDPYLCTTDPGSPYCDSVWTTEPEDPDCQTADPIFCTGEPLSPWCETSDPFYCTEDPLSPYCVAYTSDPFYCTTDPGSPYCDPFYTIDPGNPDCATQDPFFCTTDPQSPFCHTADPYYCTTDPQSPLCAPPHTMDPFWCTTDPVSPYCDPFYTFDPADPVCLTQDPFFCTVHPSSPFCHTADPYYCTTDPHSPHCAASHTVDPYWCTTDPLSPFCDTVYTLNPQDPACQTQDPYFCTAHPSSPFCFTSDPFFCTTDPISPYCTTSVESDFIRGDLDTIPGVTMADAIFLLKALYVPGALQPTCLDAADVDDALLTDTSPTMADAVYLLRWLYVPGSPPPPPPTPSHTHPDSIYPGDCGPDGTPNDSMDCGAHHCDSYKGYSVHRKLEGMMILGDAILEGSRATVPVHLQSTRPLVGIAYVITYDPSILTFVSADKVGLISEGFDFFSARPDARKGWVRVGLVADMELRHHLRAGDHQIASMVFERKPEGLDVETVLEFSTVELVDPDAALLGALTNTLSIGPFSRRRSAFALESYPNPMRDETQIRFGVIASSEVALEVYSATGQLVRTLVEDHMTAGFYTASWDGFDQRGLRASNGIYFYRLRAGDMSVTKKLVVMR